MGNINADTVRDENGWPDWPVVAAPAAVAENLQKVLQGQVWTSRAPGDDYSFTEQAETAIASLYQVKHALLVASGTVAVELAIHALKLPAGSKVIVPALGWFATAAAVCRAGAIPVYADVDPQTSCIDPQAVSDCIDEQVRAIVAVHLHCAIADLDALLAIAEQHDLYLIEDCAQAHGSHYHAKPVGNIGSIGCFSFNQEKLIAIGEGGCVITNDSQLYQRLHALRTDGYINTKSAGREHSPHGEIRGGNACTTEFCAVIALAQIEKFETLNAIRQHNAGKLDQALATVDFVEPLQSASGTTQRTWHEYVFRLDLAQLNNWSAERCGEYLEKLLGFPIHQTDEPTQECPLLQVDTPIRAAPVSQQLFETLLVFHDRMLLDERIVEKLPAALQQLRKHTEASSGQ